MARAKNKITAGDQVGTLGIIRAIDALLNLAMTFGVNISKLMAMRELNDGESLTDEQVRKLASDSQSAIDKL